MVMTQPFDTLAESYDETFTSTDLARYLRGRVHRRLLLAFRSSDHVLELGCGTGEDAAYLAGRGLRVTATDASPAMLDLARTKTQSLDTVTVAPLDLNAPHTAAGPALDDRPFDGAFSNFGPVNCVTDIAALADWLAPRIRPGGVVGLCVMSPFCAWEAVWHGLHLDFKTATRRLRHNTTFRPTPESDPITIHYPTLRQITRDFAPHFKRRHVEPIGLTVPTSDAFAVVDRRPRLRRALIGLDRRLANIRQFALLADHYWVEFVRQPAG